MKREEKESPTPMSEPRKNEPKIDADEVLNGIVEWVSIESPSHDARSVNKVVDHVEVRRGGFERIAGRQLRGFAAAAFVGLVAPDTEEDARGGR